MDDLLWVEKYRPKTIDECILPDDLKATFKQFVNNNMVPNLLLSGDPGIGKTTVARALLEQIGADYILINGSMNGNIDTLRNDILQFASTVSFSGGRKYVIIDEADNLNANSTQPALRAFIEQYSGNCGFIFTCNTKYKIIEPLHSRFAGIDFKVSKDSLVRLGAQFYKRAKWILDNEGVGYDNQVLAELIKKYNPDWRRVINELPRYSVVGTIDAGILTDFSNDNVNALMKILKSKNFKELRVWVGENSDLDSSVLFRKIYDSAHSLVKPHSVPELVLLLAKYQYQAAFVADPEINLAAFLTEMMVTVEFNESV